MAKTSFDTDLWVKAQAELSSNARLRVGVVVIAAICWLYGLIVIGDENMTSRKRIESQAEELSRIEPLLRESKWPVRADDAQAQLAQLQAGLWVESDIGLVEAAFQDWIRATANAARLNVRELSLTRGNSAGSGPTLATPAAAAAGSVATPPVAGSLPFQTVKARVVVDFNRSAILGLLSEAAASERAVVVDRMLLRNVPGGIAEIDLRILAQSRAGAPR
jgi:hypothetical protein